MKATMKFISVFILLSLGVASCKKDEILENPKPDEPELITTVRIKATDANNASDISYFTYRVENGFHEAGQNIFRVDTIKLAADREYNVEIFVLDEKQTPPVNVTEEIIEEKNSHLFYYTSTPNSGAGSIEVYDKDKDNNGQDFARVCKWRTGAAGAGQMELILIHGPRNKLAQSRDAIAGSTDAETTFPVVLY